VPIVSYVPISSVFQITAVAFSTFLYRFAAALRRRTAAKGRLDRIRGAQVLPARLRELIEGNQPIPVVVEGLADGGHALPHAPMHHAWNTRFWRSASSRVSAYGIAVSRRRPSGCSRFGSLSSTLRSRWFQHRCCRDQGKHRGQRAPDPQAAPAGLDRSHPQPARGGIQRRKQLAYGLGMALEHRQ